MDCCTLQLIFVNYWTDIFIIAQGFDLIKEQYLHVCKASLYMNFNQEMQHFTSGKKFHSFEARMTSNQLNCFVHDWFLQP